ncbi:MAG TPA: nickel pincer cofactor biosynthesis protein LarB [Chthoniobacterales bacterium]|jgi:NCAIR mutase (PurE)-related protein|nr:nickel pincer cofactor biosynthesis protein LarB [Chthoniobacterales bacterium]
MGSGFEDLGFAKVDHGREARCGRPEVIFCEGKTADEVAAISARIAAESGYVLGTRASRGQFEAVAAVLPQAAYHERARCITCGQAPAVTGNLVVGILSAGTSDLAVAEEAAVTLAAFGQRVERVYDVGVAGLHRLVDRLETVRACSVLIVAAGMEGALPSVVSGLVDRPIIAVPTSIGYGASFGGLAALLGMLNSCGSKVTVVNIDNGFGAACAADAILRLVGEAGA